MIPLATTTITVEAPDPVDDSGDPYASAPPPPRQVLAKGVRAVITAKLLQRTGTDGDTGTLQLQLNCDPCEITHRCRVTDESTGLQYSVDEVFEYTQLEALAHMKATLSGTSDDADLNAGRI